MEQGAHGGLASSCGEISEYPLQTHSALKRTHIQEEHMHGPDIMERTKAVSVRGVRTENDPLLFWLKVYSVLQWT